jgi:hypothetical protein
VARLPARRVGFRLLPHRDHFTAFVRDAAMN